MCNTHAFAYRLPAIFAASFSSCALGLLAVSGITCDFLEIRAKDGYFLYVPDATEPPVHTVASLGVLCGNELYDDVLEDHLMFLLSRISLFAGIAMGSFTVVLAWAISSFISPTEANWKLLGVFAAVAAILQMPVFLLFETDPCTAFGSQQECTLSDGSFYLILSTVCWVVVTVATQFMNPPRWADELNAWRSNPKRHRHQNERDAAGEAGQMQPIRGAATTAGQADNKNEADDGESQAPLLTTPRRQKKKQKSQEKEGYLNGFSKWAHQRRWAATAELPKNQTDSLSQGDDEEEMVQEGQIVPYYANNNTSALVLDILSNGRRPGDEGISIASFDDLDSLVKLAEEGRLPPETTCNFLAPPSRNASFATNDDADNSITDDVVTERALVVADMTQKQSVYSDLEFYGPSDEMKMVAATTPTIDEFYGPSDEMKMVAGTTTKTGLTAKPSGGAPTASAAGGPELQQDSPDKTAKSSSVIMKLTDNLKKRSRVRRSKKNNYALMDDDDMKSALPMQEVFIQTNDNGSLPDVPGTPTKQAVFPCFDVRALQVMRKRRAFDDEEYPDPIIAYMGSNDSTSEDEPDPIIASTCSHEFDDIYSRDSDSVASSSSSESSSSGEYRCSRSLQDRRRFRRSGSRGCKSVVSSTSLLDTIIAEETDADLQEHDDPSPYDLVRSKSAPTQFRAAGGQQHQQNDQQSETDDHASVSTLGSSLFQPRTSISGMDSTSGLDNIQLAPIMSTRETRSLGGNSSVSSFPKDCLHVPVSSHDSTGTDPDPLDLSFDTELEDPVDSISFSSEHPIDTSTPQKLKLKSDRSSARLERVTTEDEHRTSQPDPDGASPGQPRIIQLGSFEAALRGLTEEFDNKSTSNPGKGLSAMSPAVTAPETPSPVQVSPETSFRSEEESNPHDLSISFESERSWKEEREMRGGIHAAPLDDLDDSSSEDELSRSSRSVRVARIRRLQRDFTKKTRARTQDPPSRRRRPSPSGMSSVVDKLDLQLIDILRPDGAEYGADESSL